MFFHEVVVNETILQSSCLTLFRLKLLTVKPCSATHQSSALHFALYQQLLLLSYNPLLPLLLPAECGHALTTHAAL